MDLNEFSKRSNRVDEATAAIRNALRDATSKYGLDETISATAAVLGFMCAMKVASMAPSADLSTIAQLGEFGNGVARRFTDVMVEIAQEHGIQTTRMSTTGDNPTQN